MVLESSDKMSFTQETILKFLVDHNGKVKNSDLLRQFKDPLNSSDLGEKEQNRHLFKIFVNNIAVVKEQEGVKYVALKKQYLHLLTLNVKQTVSEPQLKACESLSKGLYYEDRNCQTQDNVTQAELMIARTRTASDSEDMEQNFSEVRGVDNLEFYMLPQETSTEVPEEQQATEIFDDQKCPLEEEPVFQRTRTASDSQLRIQDFSQVLRPDKRVENIKPFMLPLRLPPRINFVVKRVKADDVSRMSQSKPELLWDRNRTRSVFEVRTRRPLMDNSNLTSNHTRKGSKSSKTNEDLKYSAGIPLEAVMHSWLVSTACGYWTHVYGLLLQDTQLAERRDFMSGFTALHWAAKSGNDDMIRKIIEIALRGGTVVDVNSKTHGGHTALHLATIHNHVDAMVVLVRDYSARTNIRDNNGKRAYHYLHKDASAEVRELLGAPPLWENDEGNGDSALTDLTKGLSTISKLFHPHMAHKRKQRNLAELFSPSDDQDHEN